MKPTRIRFIVFIAILLISSVAWTGLVANGKPRISATRLIGTARLFYSQRRFVKAAEFYQQVLQQTPGHPEATRQLAAIRSQLGPAARIRRSRTDRLTQAISQARTRGQLGDHTSKPVIDPAEVLAKTRHALFQARLSSKRIYKLDRIPPNGQDRLVAAKTADSKLTSPSGNPVASRPSGIRAKLLRRLPTLKVPKISLPGDWAADGKRRIEKKDKSRKTFDPKELARKTREALSKIKLTRITPRGRGATTDTKPRLAKPTEPRTLIDPSELAAKGRETLSKIERKLPIVKLPKIAVPGTSLKPLLEKIGGLNKRTAKQTRPPRKTYDFKKIATKTRDAFTKMKTVFPLRKAPKANLPKLKRAETTLADKPPVTLESSPLWTRWNQSLKTTRETLVAKLRPPILANEPLRMSLESPDPTIRTLEARKLLAGTRDPAPALNVLAELVRTGTNDQAELAAYVLGKYGAKSVAALPELKDQMMRREGSVRVHVAEAILRIDPNSVSATDTLTALLRSRDKSVRMTAAFAMKGTRGAQKQRCISALIATTQDKDPHVRATAALALGGFGSEAKMALPALLKLIHDRNPETARAAAVAVLCVDPERGDDNRPVPVSRRTPGAEGS